MEAQENKPVVTKEWLAAKIKENPTKVIGRALSALYRYQLDSEKSTSSTRANNGVGFAKPDARIGSIGARMFNANGTLQQWVIDIWSMPARDGYPRLCKYANQLQQIAQAKKERLQKSPTPNINVVTL